MNTPEEANAIILADNDVLGRTKEWFEQAVPNPNTKNFTTQLGVHVEEFYEMLIELTPQDDETREALADAIEKTKHFATHLKTKGGVHVEEENHIGFLDALCDQLVTATGTAHMAGFDILGGLNEVNRSNFSKFDDEGNPIFDENMKVTKGPNYSKANLAPFI